MPQGITVGHHRVVLCPPVLGRLPLHRALLWRRGECQPAGVHNEGPNTPQIFCAKRTILRFNWLAPGRCSCNLNSWCAGTKLSSFNSVNIKGCWCPGSFHHQDISTHDTDYIEKISPCFRWERISTTCVMSVWGNEINCKYISMFPLKNLAHKGLNMR